MIFKLMRQRVVFYLNGQRKEADTSQAEMMLANYLRYELGLAGTKIVCAEGDCGACTVLRLFPWPATRKNPRYLPVNSCILTVAQMDGSSLVTVDALKDSGALTPVQRKMMICHGSQCGYCTPGFVMALTGLVEKKLCERNSTPFTVQKIKNALTGNLCRCTGYQPIIDAALSIDLSECKPVRERYYSAAQERDLRKALSEPLKIVSNEFSFYAPRTLREAASYLKKHRDARIAAGGTDVGVLHNKRKARLANVVSLHLIPELYEIKERKARITVGSRVTLTELRDFTRERVPEFAKFLDLFASPQIKNVATLAGNLANASPIGDTAPFLMIAGTVVTVLGPGGKRAIPIEKFFVGYRKTALKAGEIIATIDFDLPGVNERIALYKVSQRKDLDISTVSLALRAGRGKVIRLALGGVAATTVRMKKTEAALRESALERALKTLQAEMAPISDLRGSLAFRRVAVENLVRTFMQERR